MGTQLVDAMKISYNWLKEYIKLEWSPEQIAEVLTDIGLEVEGMEVFNGPGNGLEGVIIGEIKELQKHPNADKLNVTKTDIGTGELQQIVCGAPNAVAGQKVVVATVGATLYPMEGGEFDIKKAKIRGEESYGMICAEDELGLGESHDGIIVLPADAPVGQSYAEYLGIKQDTIFEIGLTPNRADATGHIGVARDLQAALSLRMEKPVHYHLPEIKELDLKKENPISLKVENTEACPRYSGIYLTGLQVGESPDWLKQRLLSVGLRPINNVVDITNFILQEFGQPLHAFDAAKIAGKQVIVKTLPQDTKFTTLDEQERKLSDHDLMICNAEEGMCIAGVFGGVKSGVTESTTDVFLESAYFDSVWIRKTAGRHNLRTDAAQRYEKGTDPNVTITALKRAVNLLQELAGAQVASGILDEYPNPVAPFKVDIKYANVNTLIGCDIPKEQVKQILQDLEIVITGETAEGLSLEVPPFKVDVQREADVIEEVLRIYGINNVPFPENMHFSVAKHQYPDKERVTERIADGLTAAGYYEIMTNSIVDAGYVERFQPEDKDRIVRLMNSLNHDLNAMRSSMLYSGLEAIRYNVNRRNLDLKLFEFGHSYAVDAEGKFAEPEHLALYLTGKADAENWRNTPVANADFYALKGQVDNVLAQLGITGYEEVYAESKQLSFGLQYNKGEKVLVSLGAVADNILKYFDLKQPVYVALFNWNLVMKLLGRNKTGYTAVSKFPGIRRDLALLINEDVSYGAIEKIAREEVKRILKSVNLFDTYEDPKLGAGKKSYAVSFVFEDDKKTLTDKDIEKVMDKLLKRYRDELQAEIRS